MDRNTLINFTVDKEIETLFPGNYDVIKFLQRHPQKIRLIDNLNTEIRLCELRMNMTTEKVMGVAIDFTRMFAKVAINVKEQELNQEHIRLAKLKMDKKRKREEEMNAPIQEIIGDVVEVIRGN